MVHLKMRKAQIVVKNHLVGIVVGTALANLGRTGKVLLADGQLESLQAGSLVGRVDGEHPFPGLHLRIIGHFLQFHIHGPPTGHLGILLRLCKYFVEQVEHLDAVASLLLVLHDHLTDEAALGLRRSLGAYKEFLGLHPCQRILLLRLIIVEQ